MRRAAFTLIELLVVLTIIAALSALIIPTLVASQKKGAIDATRSVIEAVVSQIQNDVSKNGPFVHLSYPSKTTRRRWDFNDDKIVDGDPETDPTFLAGDRDLAHQADDGGPRTRCSCAYHSQPSQGGDARPYRGFQKTIGIGATGRFQNQKTGRVCDAWGKPLRIRFARGDHPLEYGTTGFVILSDGPDGQPDTADDISSLKKGDQP